MRLGEVRTTIGILAALGYPVCPVNAFLPAENPLHRNGALAASRISEKDSAIIDDPSSNGRRSLLSWSVGAATSLVVGATQYRKQESGNAELWTAFSDPRLEPAVDSTVSQNSKVETLSEALTLIEEGGDKRFLHAVVASGYQCFYGPNPSSIASTKYVLSTSVTEELEESLQGRPIQLSKSKLLVSSRKLAKETWKGQEIGTLWPLMNAD